MRWLLGISWRTRVAIILFAFPVLALLSAASAAGLQLAIATTTSPVNIAALLRQAIGPDWKQHFLVIEDASTAPRKKPDPLPLLHAAEKYRASPQECCLIGDSVTDVKAARAAGFYVVCVSYGYNHGQDIRDAKPDRVVDSLAELAEIRQQ